MSQVNNAKDTDSPVSNSPQSLSHDFGNLKPQSRLRPVRSHGNYRSASVSISRYPTLSSTTGTTSSPYRAEGLVSPLSRRVVSASIPTIGLAPFSHSSDFFLDEAMISPRRAADDRRLAGNANPAFGRRSARSSLEDDVPEENQRQFERFSTVPKFILNEEILIPNREKISSNAPNSSSNLLKDALEDAVGALQNTSHLSGTTITSASSRESDISQLQMKPPPTERQSSVRFQDTSEIIPSTEGTESNCHHGESFISLTEEELIEAAIKASEREYDVALSRESSTSGFLTQEEIDEIKSNTRNLHDASKTEHSERDIIESLVDVCKQDVTKITNAIQSAVSRGEALEGLFELNDRLNEAIAVGENALKEIELSFTKKQSSTVPGTPRLDIPNLIEKRDIFTLICTLRLQNNFRLEATLALMHFARDAEGGTPEQARLRDEIRSSGGMHSFLTVFESPNVSYELKVVAAMAVAYLSPSFVEASVDLHASIALKIVECIRFLTRCRTVTPMIETITRRDACDAASVSLAAFWLTYLGPKLNSDVSTAIVTVENTPLAKRWGNGAIIDQRRENIALREVLEIAVSLIIDIANQSNVSATSLTLVEQVCAVEIARPVAVREGILQTLVRWSESGDPEFIRTAALSLQCLTSINDAYMAGWIHSEMVNKGAVKALANLTHTPEISHDVRLAIAQILASLCVAPHTRAAVVEANCIQFLVGFLYEPSEASLREVILSAGSALVHLARGAITRATILNDDEQADENDLSSHDHGKLLLDDILESGAIDQFVKIARDRRDKLRSIAVEGLRILSEDISWTRQTRLRLCKDGAAASLGTVLKDIVGPIPAKFHLNQAVMGLSHDEKKQLQEGLCALANILEPIQDSSRRKRLSTHLLLDTSTVLIEGCIDTATHGGLDSILKIASFPFTITSQFNAITTQVNGNSSLSILEEACRSLAALAPLLLTHAIARKGFAVRAHEVLNAMHGVLKALVSSLEAVRNSEIVKETAADLREIVLTGLRVLAQSEPLIIRIVDRTLPYLTKIIGSEGSSGPSSAASQFLQSLDVFEDEIVSQVAGNNPNLLADWFCIQRSLLIQAMARAEIRRVIINTWGSSFREVRRLGLTNLVGEACDRSLNDDGSVDMDLFENFANDESTSRQRQLLIQQYHDMYGEVEDQAGLEAITQNDQCDESLLACQIYPLNSSSIECQWILDHFQFLEAPMNETEGAIPCLSKHVSLLLDTHFPSTLLRDQMFPIRDLRPNSSYNFRSLMMPQRRYFSFQREAKLLSRICDIENASVEDDGIHWTLGFTNSSFDEEFAESLVNFLYLCPMVRGLSFCRDDQWETIKNADKELHASDGSYRVASLAGSLPPWITHLTFVDMLTQDDLSTIISILENVGRLSDVQEASPDVVVQGKFSFLAISKSQCISPDVWQQFFGLFSRSTIPNSTKALTSLKSLDLSFNGLGDDLCSKVLEFTLLEDCSRCLEFLDLSGNHIRAAQKVIRVLHVAGRRGKTFLRTLNLASNSLSNNGAWLDIVDIFKRDAFRLQELDLSANEIFLSTFDEAGLFVGSILSYKTLVRLNMSNNRVHPSAIDYILRSLAEPEQSRGCTIGFLEFENNDPALNPEQSRLLLEFCARSRRTLFERCSLERNIQDDPENLDEEGDERVERVDDLPYEAFPDQTSLAPADSQFHDPLPTPVEIDNVITVLFSAPLVYRDGQKRFQPFKKLNFEMERELMWQCLKEASRDIELTFDNATSERLLATIAKRCSCLHYSGHGHMQFLPFENTTGGAEWFAVSKFKELIQNESSVPFRFVFVSACHSGLAGETFASAGVPHVVCCQQEYELKDTAALAFTRQFYLALAVGNTVKESFEQGCRAVRATPNLKDAEKEMQKFVLLPRDGDHNVPIFNAKPVREWPRVLSEEAKRLRRNSRFNRKGALPSVALRNLELNVRNLIQDDPSPTPPQFFLGREVEMYHVFNLLLSKRLVSIVGENGIGRSSLVCSLCHYVNERRNIISTSIEKIYFVKAKKFKKKSRFVSLIKTLLKRLVDEGKVQDVADEDDKETVIEAICGGLKKMKALLVFDRVDLLDDSDDLTEFPMLLSELIRETKDVKILLTNQRPLGIPALGEQHFSLGPLNFESTVRLFAHLCPNVHRPGDRQKLIDSLVTSKEAGQLLPGPDIPEPIKYLFDILGRGIPSRIENAAFCLHKDIVERLKDGSFRDDL